MKLCKDCIFYEYRRSPRCVVSLSNKRYITHICIRMLKSTSRISFITSEEYKSYEGRILDCEKERSDSDGCGISGIYYEDKLNRCY